MASSLRLLLCVFALSAAAGCTPPPSGYAQSYAPMPATIPFPSEEAFRQAESSRQYSPQDLPSSNPSPIVPAADVQSMIAGKTMTLEIVRPGRGGPPSVSHPSIFFASNGRAYSAAFEGAPWHVQAGSVCIGGGVNDCTALLIDRRNGQVLANSVMTGLIRVSSIADGDPNQLRYAARRTADQQRAQAELIGGILRGMMSSGSEPSGGAEDGPCSAGANPLGRPCGPSLFK